LGNNKLVNFNSTVDPSLNKFVPLKRRNLFSNYELMYPRLDNFRSLINYKTSRKLKMLDLVRLKYNAICIREIAESIQTCLTKKPLNEIRLNSTPAYQHSRSKCE
jgi:hypothetical protein